MIRPVLLFMTTATIWAAAPVGAAERRFALTGFDRVAVAGSDDVQITNGNFSVVAEGAADDLDRLDIRVDGGVLKIRRKTNGWSGRGKDVRVTVALPALRGLTLAGSADVTADRAAADRFGLSISGSGGIRLADLDTKTADIELSGSGDMVVGGRCGALNVRVAGSGDANLGGLRCTNASISIAGSGDVSAHVAGDASIRVAGSGDVVIAGGARCTTKIAGSGTVRCS
jgi:hypothetical protein